MKKLSFISAMLAMVLVFGLASVSCNSEAPDNGENGTGKPSLPGPGAQVGQGSSWPSSSKLAEYTLGGLNQPTGLGGITWTETKITETHYSLHITFTQTTAATRNSIDDFLRPWDSSEPNWIQDDQTVSVTYVKRGGDLRYGVIVYYELSTGGYIVIDRVSEDEIDPLA